MGTVDTSSSGKDSEEPENSLMSNSGSPKNRLKTNRLNELENVSCSKDFQNEELPLQDVELSLSYFTCEGYRNKDSSLRGSPLSEHFSVEKSSNIPGSDDPSMKHYDDLFLVNEGFSYEDEMLRKVFQLVTDRWEGSVASKSFVGKLWESHFGMSPPPESDDELGGLCQKVLKASLQNRIGGNGDNSDQISGSSKDLRGKRRARWRKEKKD